MANDDGGPAFPKSGWVASGKKAKKVIPKSEEPQESISLRDWLAGMALQGLLANPGRNILPRDVAELAYDLADIMLQVREE